MKPYTLVTLPMITGIAIGECTPDMNGDGFGFIVTPSARFWTLVRYVRRTNTWQWLEPAASPSETGKDVWKDVTGNRVLRAWIPMPNDPAED